MRTFKLFAILSVIFASLFATTQAAAQNSNYWDVVCKDGVRMMPTGTFMLFNPAGCSGQPLLVEVKNPTKFCIKPEFDVIPNPVVIDIENVGYGTWIMTESGTRYVACLPANTVTWVFLPQSAVVMNGVAYETPEDARMTDPLVLPNGLQAPRKARNVTGTDPAGGMVTVPSEVGAVCTTHTYHVDRGTQMKDASNGGIPILSFSCK